MQKTVTYDDKTGELPPYVVETLNTKYGPAKKKFKDYYKPVTGVYPAEKVVLHNHTRDAVEPMYYAMAGTPWNNKVINSQGRKFVAADANNIAYGAAAQPSQRLIGARHFFAIDITGDRLSAMFNMFGYYDTQVYVLEDNQLMKLRDKPMRDNVDPDAGYTGVVFLNVQFKEIRKRTIYINAPFCHFIQLVHESSAMLSRTKDREMVYIGGDSYSDMGTSFNDYGTDGPTRKAARESSPKIANTYACYGLTEAFFEATGLIVLANGHGSTGRFNNGSGVASEARNTAQLNCSSFWSEDNLACLMQYGPGSVLAAMWWGTINDGELSGGTIGMRNRVIERLNTIAEWDPGILLGLTSPEPLNYDGVTELSGVHELNRQGDLAAIDSIPNLKNGLGYMDLFKPPLWTGTGSIRTNNGNGATPQSQLIGADGLHGLHQMYQLCGLSMAQYFGEAIVPAVRGAALS